jgi:hypothetical protein
VTPSLDLSCLPLSLRGAVGKARLILSQENVGSSPTGDAVSWGNGLACWPFKPDDAGSNPVDTTVGVGAARLWPPR